MYPGITITWKDKLLLAVIVFFAWIGIGAAIGVICWIAQHAHVTVRP